MRESRDGLVETPEQYRFASRLVGLRDPALPLSSRSGASGLVKSVTGLEVHYSVIWMTLCWVVGLGLVWYNWCSGSDDRRGKKGGPKLRRGFSALDYSGKSSRIIDNDYTSFVDGERELDHSTTRSRSKKRSVQYEREELSEDYADD
jgi:hypothetical protein